MCICIKDTIGSPGIQRSIGGDGADREHGHANDEVGHQEHGDTLVESRLSNHEPWLGNTQVVRKQTKHKVPGQRQNFGPASNVGAAK